jgi:hypothetical protein
MCYSYCHYCYCVAVSIFSIVGLCWVCCYEPMLTITTYRYGVWHWCCLIVAICHVYQHRCKHTCTSLMCSVCVVAASLMLVVVGSQPLRFNKKWMSCPLL